MERVHLDFLGPLPTTPRGNSFILMMVDQFTKWVECIPLPSQTTEVTARAAINEFFTRFGSQIKGPILVANYSKIYVKCLRLVKPGQPLSEHQLMDK